MDRLHGCSGMLHDMKPRAHKPFGEALADALREKQAARFGRISLRAFFSRIEGWSYDALRKMANGELRLTPEVMEACARELGIAPTYWREYRAYQIEQQMESNPELIDAIYDLVMSEAAKLPMKGAENADSGR